MSMSGSALLDLLRSKGLTLEDLRQKYNEYRSVAEETRKLIEEDEEMEQAIKRMFEINGRETLEVENLTAERDECLRALLGKQRENQDLVQRCIDLFTKLENDRVAAASRNIVRRQLDFIRRRQAEAGSDTQDGRRRMLAEEVARMKDKVASLQAELEVKHQSHAALKEQLKKLEAVKLALKVPSPSKMSDSDEDETENWTTGDEFTVFPELYPD